ncbi:MAG: LytR/AlgR family response regulator transcription factor [Dolichospermum sp.]
MSTIKIIHIDDDAQTLLNSKEIFELNSLLTYKGGFSNAKEAIDFLDNNKVDIVFCDIEMPEYNGIWLSGNLPYTIPVVFITAHTDFAIKAFDACALHYLMKPLSLKQVNEVIERYQKQGLKQTHLQDQISQFYNQYLPQDNQNIPKKIFINSIGKISVIDLENLMFLSNDGNYTKFTMVDGESHIASKNLKIYDEALHHHPDFVRIHRTYLINKKYVKQILKLNKEQWFVLMSNGEKLELSKGRLDEILARLQY